MAGSSAPPASVWSAVNVLADPSWAKLLVLSPKVRLALVPGLKVPPPVKGELAVSVRVLPVTVLMLLCRLLSAPSARLVSIPTALVTLFSVASTVVSALTVGLAAVPPRMPEPALVPTLRTPVLVKFSVPPKGTEPPPLKPVPAFTVSEGLTSMAFVTPPGAMLSVPLVVIGPPVKPAPLTMFVTVPVPAPGKVWPEANVIALRALPAEARGKPAGGRRLLCFSDSRQRAAYFAPYLGRTTAETQYMKPLLDAIGMAYGRTQGEGASFDEVADCFYEAIRRQEYVAIREPLGDSGEFKSVIKRAQALLPADRRAVRRECLISLFQHFTASPRNRQNLPGLAPAFLHVAWTDEDRDILPARLPWLFSEGWEVGNAVLQWCLRIFTWRRALIFPEGIRLQNIGPGPQAATFHYTDRGSRDGRQVHRWSPYYASVMRDLVVGRSPQAEVVARFLGLDKLASGDRVSTRLQEIWDSVRDLGILQQVYPNEFQLSCERLLVSTEGTWFSCSRCGMMTVHPVREACVVAGCGGRLSRMTTSELMDRLADHLRRTPKVKAIFSAIS